MLIVHKGASTVVVKRARNETGLVHLRTRQLPKVRARAKILLTVRWTTSAGIVIAMALLEAVAGEQDPVVAVLMSEDGRTIRQARTENGRW